MLSNISDNALKSIRYPIFDHIRTLEKQNTCLTSIFSRVFIIGSSGIDSILVFSFPFIFTVEKLAFAAINFLGERLGFQSCNSDDGWKSLKDAKMFDTCSEFFECYLSLTLVSIFNLYLNLKNPAEAKCILAGDSPFEAPILQSWIEYPTPISGRAS